MEVAMKRLIGSLGVLFGTLVLSLQLYGLKWIQSLEKMHGEWWYDVWMYATEPPCAIALLLTVAVLIVSAAILGFTFFQQSCEKECGAKEQKDDEC